MGCYLAYWQVNPAEGSYNGDCKDEGLQAKRDEVTCPRSLSYKVAELGFGPRWDPFWRQCVKSTAHLAPELHAFSSKAGCVCLRLGPGCQVKVKRGCRD